MQVVMGRSVSALKESLLPPGKTKIQTHQERPRPRPEANPDQDQNQSQNPEKKKEKETTSMTSETPFVPRGTVADIYK